MRGSLCRVRVAASQRCYQDWAAISVWLLKGIFRKAKAANISLGCVWVAGTPSPLQAASQPLQGSSPVNQNFGVQRFSGGHFKKVTVFSPVAG